ncbi:MAG: hypothetical protein PHH14_06165 [Candidatus Margulisbacteria bacterium]|nr:hypothetical protein [Candidatus Margulisiibacteriota bacterium]
MKITKIFRKNNCKAAPHLLNKTNVTSEELIHRCFGGDIRILWKAARDEIPAAPLD